MSAPLTFWVRPMGDQALLIRLLSPESILTSAQKYELLLVARHLANYLNDLPHKPALVAQAELVAGYDSVLVAFTPESQPTSAITSWLEVQVAAFVQLYLQNPEMLNTFAPDPIHHQIPVIYGGDYGLDLENVAHINNITPSQVIELHSSHTYEVYFVGFAPGYAYLGPLPLGLDAPRLERPRPRVKAGTVALAAGLTAIYPHTSPGGWQLIGYTATQVFEPRREPPNLLRPGDKVTFVPILAQP